VKTSYFAKYKGKDGVSIALSTPKWFKFQKEISLMPTWDMINGIKNGSLSKDQYEKIYREKILFLVDPFYIYEKYENSVLLCWEKIGEFCHRRIVAEWIEEETENEVEEYGIWKY